MRKVTRPLLIGAAALAGLATLPMIDAALSGQAAAQRITRERPPAGPPQGGYVTAESRWGHGTVSGPVRRAQHGWEVRLPGGTWIPCKRSCSEELRFATVDFWETQGRNPPDGGPNYFRFDFRF